MSDNQYNDFMEARRELLSYAKIGERFGVSGQRVHQVLSAAHDAAQLRFKRCRRCNKRALVLDMHEEFCSKDCAIQQAAEERRAQEFARHFLTISQAADEFNDERHTFWNAIRLGYIAKFMDKDEGVAYVARAEARAYAKNPPGRGHKGGAEDWRAEHGFSPASL